MKIAFINENTLGHTAYLPRFVDEFERNPEWKITPSLLNVTPLLEPFRHRAERSIPGLRRWGLDLSFSRWRKAASASAREQFQRASIDAPVDGLVVNTQSVALDLVDLFPRQPSWICLDATFQQLLHTPWFSPLPSLATLLQKLQSELFEREREVFTQAHRLVAWSAPVRDSLVRDYGIATEKILTIPPALRDPLPPGTQMVSKELRRPRFLFIGGDFVRKGGPLVLECFQRYFAGRSELEIITHSPLPEMPGVTLRRGITPGSDAWRESWSRADLFMFPSALETFGIVLIEALAFGVPVIASQAGAARDILDNEKAGWLLKSTQMECLRDSIEAILSDTDETFRRRCHGRSQFLQRFELTKNAARWVQDFRQKIAP